MCKRHVLSAVLALIFLSGIMFPGTAKIYAEENEIYGYISYVENEAYVLKTQEDITLKAGVNLPLVPGDVIYTGNEGRCELQFDNGTIIRLDKNSELKLDTVLSKSLTTENKITTLQLRKGQIYNMNQVYKQEIFQVITPNAAVKMMKRSTNSIMVNDKGETNVFVIRGKVGVLYGKDQKALKNDYLEAKKGLWITEDHQLKADNTVINKNFFNWNKKINANFKDLHYGKSKVPAVIYRRSPGIVRFAEKWSTKFGEWVYDDLFGYVWKPYADVYDGRRPFWDANYVEINGELVMVPNQPWGWAPAHLGTWFWSNQSGWVWIPGDAFSRGICTVGLVPMGVPIMDYWFCSSPRCYAFSSLGHWIYYVYGDYQLYTLYRNHGSRAWLSAYQHRYQKKPAAIKLALKNVPQNARSLIKVLNKTHVEQVEKHLVGSLPGTGFIAGNGKLLKNTNFDRNRSVLVREHNIRVAKADLGKAGKNQGLISHGRDWNPDARWANKVGTKILYSSNKNAVVCPKYKLFSDKISNLQRTMLRRSVMNRRLLDFNVMGAGANGAAASYSSTSPSSPVRSSSQAGASNNSGSSSGGHGGGSSATKK